MSDKHPCISCGQPTPPEDYLNVEVYTPKDAYISIVPLCADCLRLFGWQDAILPWLASVREEEREEKKEKEKVG